MNKINNAKSRFMLPLLSVFMGASALSLSTNSTAQNCHTDTIAETTPSTQYVIHGDGTITDTTTALMWKQCVEGLSGTDCTSGIEDLLTWTGALQSANNINTSGGFAGYADWRVPNVAELVTLVEEQCTDPSINENVFPNTANKFIWSSSPDFNNDNATWSVDFNVGTTATLQRDFSYRARLVRSIQ